MHLIETQRLLLRPSTDADRADLHALEQDPDVMRYLNGGLPTPLDVDGESEAFLMPRGGEPGIWIAIERASDAFLGWFCLYEEGDGSAELGYRLLRACWGQGYASEGAAALVDFGFRDRGCCRIVANTMAVNLASRRIMEKIGLKHIRTTHAAWADPLPGADQGDVEYQILRDDWAARRL